MGLSRPSGRVAAAVGTPSVAEAAGAAHRPGVPGAAGAELVLPEVVGDAAAVVR